ncbi:MAG: hypothetical protein KBF88_08200 [Polyangiaceae bacterium]|nr:hypothetical protein [Polyangiaceae bacterium]
MLVRRSLGVLIAFSAILGPIAYGCSAGNEEDPADATTDVTNDVKADKTDTSNQEDTSTADVKDAAKDVVSEKVVITPDASFPDTGAEGTPCPAGAVEEKPCGLCGLTQRACLPSAKADGGSVWGAWGFCQRERSGPDACDPTKNYADKACGNCGAQVQICQNDCSFAQGLPCKEPVFGSASNPIPACKPTSKEFKIGLSCPATQGRERNCSATCQWELGLVCLDPPANPNFVDVPGVAGVTAEKAFTFSKTKMLKRIGGFGQTPCPLSALGTNADTPYQYIEVKNTTGKAVTVSVWHKPAFPDGGGDTPDTLMAYYNQSYAPSEDPVDRFACVKEIRDTCEKSYCGPLVSFTPRASGFVLSDGNAISIAAGKSITIYLATYSASLPGNKESVDLTVAVKTETIN